MVDVTDRPAIYYLVHNNTAQPNAFERKKHRRPFHIPYPCPSSECAIQVKKNHPHCPFLRKQKNHHEKYVKEPSTRQSTAQREEQNGKKKMHMHMPDASTRKKRKSQPQKEKPPFRPSKTP